MSVFESLVYTWMEEYLYLCVDVCLYVGIGRGVELYLCVCVYSVCVFGDGHRVVCLGLCLLCPQDMNTGFSLVA